MPYTTNPYYNPETFGLKIVQQLDEADLSYEFNMLAVWKNKKNEFFYAQDSGCSCPSPFEDYEGEESLTKITKRNFDVFEQEVNDFPAPASERKKLIAKVKKNLK